ncbi:alpha/beta hydrolase family protein [Roseateles sp. So40a]|uniref:alpha/beta hydrolase family protein n=1 Tax=Roseateles sp. So40a TaxID=3400226 RepID=UPI003A8B833A
MTSRLLGALGIAAALAGAMLAGAAHAQDTTVGETVNAAPARLALDIREAIVRVPVSVENHIGRTLQAELIVTTFRPAGSGPFPLVVLNHGRPVDEHARAAMPRQRLEGAARFFVRKGFAVAVPTRLGYGELAAVGDPEASVRCDAPRYETAGAAAAAQVAAVVRFMQSAADIDAQRVVLAGQSLGGFATIAATGERLPGVVAAIDFAGGHGGNPDTHTGEPCRPDELARRFADFGRRAAQDGHPVPTLWVYTENDRFIAPRHQERWSAAYREAGGLAQVHPMPAFGSDGHQLFAKGNDVWQPIVDDFLRPLGFPIPGALLVARGGAVAVEDTRSLPADGRVVNGYRQFLAAREPRAFATNGNHWGLAVGDDAASRALALCDRHTEGEERCRLYAINRTVVWSTP